MQSFAGHLQLDRPTLDRHRRAVDNRSSESDREQWLRVPGLRPDASESDIRPVYRGLVKIYHPDKLGNATTDLGQAAGKFRQIREAYENLMRET